MPFAYTIQWDPPAGVPRRTEESIYERDGWRCQAPGCASRRNLEAHHVVYRSRGGDAKARRPGKPGLYSQHGEHGELMRVRGRAPDDLTFRMGRKGRGGAFRNERLAERMERARSRSGI